MAVLPGSFGTQIEIHEHCTWLRVRSDDKLAALVLTRHNGDLVGEPVGLFSMRIDDRQLAELRDAVESTAWVELPQPSGGDITASQLEIDYKRGSRLIRREFNARSGEFIDAISPLMDQLEGVSCELLMQPAGALAVAVETEIDPVDARRRVLKLALENVGTWPIVLTDPRVAKPQHAVVERACLFVAPAPDETPGMTSIPPRWSIVELPPLPQGADELHVLPRGGKLELSVSWQPPGPGPYVVQGVWHDYGGPIRNGVDHLPIMPLRGDDEPAPTGTIVAVRGAAFSVYASFVV